MAGVPALSMRGISKSFPGVRALQSVDFDAVAGEVHAICGENGAGKSTLIKILGGIEAPDEGTILIGGREVRFRHPVEACRAGIGIIHQELSILPDRTVAENIHLGREARRRGFLDRRTMRTQAAALLVRLGSDVSPDASAGSLSVAEQQIVEIAKALAHEPSILVMDEPTAALDGKNAARLLNLIGSLRAEGVAIVYVSHRMAEIEQVAGRVTVLKDGRRVASEPIGAMPPRRIVQLMVGRELSDFFPSRCTATGTELLAIEGGGNECLHDITLSVRRGEIVGVAGLEGSGKSALARAILGDEPFTRGTMRLAGTRIAPAKARSGIAAGIGYLPDDRKREGLLLGQSVRDNAALTVRAFLQPLRSRGSGGTSDGALDERLRALDVRAGNFGSEVGALSGGNQQKVIIARWLARDPALLVFAEPTRGIDVAAKTAIYRTMRALADEGRGILMISSDLPEIVGVSDRILVMREGRLAGALPSGASEDVVMALAVGVREPEPA